MGVGPEDRGDASVEVPSHRHLLAGQLGVKVDDDRVGLAVEALEQRLRLGERRAGGAHVLDAAEVDNRDPLPVHGHHDVSPARAAGLVVGGADHALGVVEVSIDLAVAVDVVAGRDHAGAEPEQLLRDGFGDARAAGGVLAVDDHQIGPVALAQPGHRPGQTGATGLAHHVADEQDPHRASVPAAGIAGGRGR